MHPTLNLCQQLLERGRHLRRLGQTRAATSLLRKLATFRNLPTDIAHDTQGLLGELQLDDGQYKSARRHLAAVLLAEPDEPHWHYLMALAIQEDPSGDARRALFHAREAARLDPEHPQYQFELGMQSLAGGQVKSAIAALRRAAELAPDDPDLLGQIAEGLRDADQATIARDLLRAALFRHPRDRRFRALWDRHQFDAVRSAQAEQDSVWAVADDQPIILPFVQPRKARKVGRRTVRTDAAAEPSGPKLLPRRLTPRRKAK